MASQLPDSSDNPDKPDNPHCGASPRADEPMETQAAEGSQDRASATAGSRGAGGEPGQAVPQQRKTEPEEPAFAPEQFSPSPFFPLVAGIFEGSLAVVALGLGWLVGQRPLETLHLDVRAALLGLAATVPLVALLLVCLKLPWQPLRRIVQIMDELVVPLFRACRLGELAIIAALAGLGEELLFRGVIQAATARVFEGLPGVVFGLCVAAVLFGAAHALTRTYAVLAALIGLYLGIIWLATGNLLVPIVAHGGYDFLVLVYLVRFRGRSRGADRESSR